MTATKDELLEFIDDEIIEIKIAMEMAEGAGKEQVQIEMDKAKQIRAIIEQHYAVKEGMKNE